MFKTKLLQHLLPNRSENVTSNSIKLLVCLNLELCFENDKCFQTNSLYCSKFSSQNIPNSLKSETHTARDHMVR